MFKFGSGSLAKLDGVHPHLAEIAHRALALSPYDFSIIHGYRGEEAQNALFDSRASTKRYPDSKHNTTHSGFPMSEAIDFAPYVNGVGIPWDETHIFAVIAGCMFAVAAEMELTLRWGGDWDGDANTKEHNLQDWGHMEVIL